MDGFALLGSHLGDPNRRILTDAKIRQLTERIRFISRENPNKQLEAEDLTPLGYGETEIRQILSLLSDREQLSLYLQEGQRQGCHLLTRGDEDYPVQQIAAPVLPFLQVKRQLITVRKQTEDLPDFRLTITQRGQVPGFQLFIRVFPV